MCRAKFLAVKEDFMLLAVGIISTSAFVLNPEHWKQVPSFLNKLAPHGGEKKKKKKEACLCVLAQLGDRQATGRDAKEGTPSSLLAGSVHALVEGLWPSTLAERRALALLPACSPRASASAQLERTQRDAALLATSSDPTRQLSPRAAAECCNKQPINHSELYSVAFFFSLLLW